MPQTMAKSRVGVERSVQVSGSERVSPAAVCSEQTLLSLIFVVNDLHGIVLGTSGEIPNHDVFKGS